MRMDIVTQLKALITTQGKTPPAGNSIAECIAVLATVPTEIIIKSSTPDSTKKFKIIVVDAGTVSATEITSE